MPPQNVALRTALIAEREAWLRNGKRGRYTLEFKLEAVPFPANADQGPATRPEEYPGLNGKAHFDEGIFVGYRWYDERKQTPLFPFGYGLSYTTFRLSGLQVSRVNDSIHVTLSAENIGARLGSDVIEVYVEAPASAEEPPSQLKGFKKIVLQRGEKQNVSIDIPIDSLSGWDETTHKWRLWDGDYHIKVGESSRSLPLQASVTLTSSGAR